MNEQAKPVRGTINDRPYKALAITKNNVRTPC